MYFPVVYFLAVFFLLLRVGRHICLVSFWVSFATARRVGLLIEASGLPTLAEVN